MRIIPVDFLRTSNEEYFIGAENDKHAIILIKLYFNSYKKLLILFKIFIYLFLF